MSRRGGAAALLTGVVAALIATAAWAGPTTTAQPAQGGNSDAVAEAATLNGLDFSGLSATQVSEILEILHENRCNCSCSMDLAECRVKDSKCTRSLTMGQQVIDHYRKGMARDEVVGALKTALARSQKQPAAAAGADVAFDIDLSGSPFKGPETAPVTIVEFSDYQ